MLTKCGDYSVLLEPIHQNLDEFHESRISGKMN
jgi:hypothetical protein